MVKRIAPWTVAAIAVLGAWMAVGRAGPPTAAKEAVVPDPISRQTVDRLEAELVRMKALIPEQSAAMLTVAQQFSNLWYAAKEKNWPLATFFLEETQEGIAWAVKLKPVHDVAGIGQVELANIFEALEKSVFPEVALAISMRDQDRFRAGYRHALEGCYACHKAVGKPFLRPTIPSEPATWVINFDPQARWPQ